MGGDIKQEIKRNDGYVAFSLLPIKKSKTHVSVYSRISL